MVRRDFGQEGFWSGGILAGGILAGGIFVKRDFGRRDFDRRDFGWRERGILPLRHSKPLLEIILFCIFMSTVIALPPPCNTRLIYHASPPPLSP